MAGESGVLNVGMTASLEKRVGEHRSKLVPGFTQKYNVTKLVWFEAHNRFEQRYNARRRSRPGGERTRWR
jgi:putative endonuclease